MRPLLGLMLMTGLCACDLAEMADKVGRRAADSVVLPVVSRSLQGPQAQAATQCIVANASAAEVQSLARDVGVEAGTSTVATIAAIASRPDTRDCLGRAGAPLGGDT